MQKQEEDWRRAGGQEVRVLPSRIFFNEISELILDLLNKNHSQKEKKLIIFGGGKTPLGLNENLVSLAKTTGRANIFEHFFYFLSDERYVMMDHPLSNYRMIRETFLTPLNLPPHCLVGINTNLPIEEACANYELQLRPYMNNQQVLLSLLGLGPDGHTASLFPGRNSASFSQQLVTLGGLGPEGLPRVSLTYQAFSKSENIWFMIKGKEKKDAFLKLISSRYDPLTNPAQAVCSRHLKCTYFIDEELASEIQF